MGKEGNYIVVNYLIARRKQFSIHLQYSQYLCNGSTIFKI